VCGPHASGKTTIIQMLKDHLVADFFEFEIGKELFYLEKITTDKVDDSFDSRITIMELERDNTYKDKTGVLVVESWHPGNLAYVIVRNEHMTSSIVSQMLLSPLISNAHVIWLNTSKENIFHRTKTFAQKREWAADFYDKLSWVIPKALKYLSLLDNFTIVDTNQPLDEVYNEVVKIVNLYK
jgi:thymidylate kinase